MITSVDKLLENACHKIVLVRVDYNLPMQNGKVSDATRIEQTLKTIHALCKSGAKVGLLSHFGRPEGTGFDAQYSLQQILTKVEEVLKMPVTFLPDCCGIKAHNGLQKLANGQVALMENLRFYAGEEKNDLSFGQSLASLGHAYVNEAFSCSHRAHASICAVTNFLPSYAGYQLSREIEMLERILKDPARPLTAVIGGSKVSTKLTLIRNLLEKADYILIGGGMANTFLKAAGEDIGGSFHEAAMVDEARELLRENPGRLVVPVDGYAGRKSDSPQAPLLWRCGEAVREDYGILDIGPQTVALFADHIAKSQTVVWNGPMGVFECPPYDRGTTEVAAALARHKGTRIAGGGDTLSALKKAGHAARMTYVSTAGGAFLEWLEGKTLPGIAALDKSVIRKQ